MKTIIKVISFVAMAVLCVWVAGERSGPVPNSELFALGAEAGDARGAQELAGPRVVRLGPDSYRENPNSPVDRSVGDEEAGVLSGRVCFPDGSGSPGVEVCLVKVGHKNEICKTDEFGRYSFIGQPSNVGYGVFLVHTSLPNNFQAPGKVHTNYGSQKDLPMGYFARRGMLSIDGSCTLDDIVLVGGAGFFGFVVRPDGSPVVGASIRLEPWMEGGEDGVGFRATQTKPDGSFAIDGMPGKYKLVIRHIDSGLPADGQLAGIPPRTVDVRLGVYENLGVMVVGGGRYTLVGRVIDQFGNPVSDLEVLVIKYKIVEDGEPPFTLADQLCQVHTDEDGVYTLAGMYEDSLLVRVGGRDIETTLHLTGKRLARKSDDLLVDLHGSSSGIVDMPECQVVTSQPFKVSASVETAKDKLHLGGHSVWFVKESYLHAPAGAQDKSQGIVGFFSLGGEADFIEWSCQTPHEPVYMRLKDSNGKIIHEEVLTPSFAASLSRTIVVE
ncbi:MAG: hypothetical protein GY930_11270 [bacterium]|nr:hypothetical protein [bacterium]